MGATRKRKRDSREGVLVVVVVVVVVGVRERERKSPSALASKRDPNRIWVFSSGSAAAIRLYIHAKREEIGGKSLG